MLKLTRAALLAAAILSMGACSLNSALIEDEVPQLSTEVEVEEQVRLSELGVRRVGRPRVASTPAAQAAAMTSDERMAVSIRAREEQLERDNRFARRAVRSMCNGC